MRAEGNDNPRICVMNLLRTKMGEVPYDRARGFDSSVMDRPTTIAMADYVEDAKRVIEDYESRVDPQSIGLKAASALNGNFAFLASIRLKDDDEIEEDSDE